MTRRGAVTRVALFTVVFASGCGLIDKLNEATSGQCCCVPVTGGSEQDAHWSTQDGCPETWVCVGAGDIYHKDMYALCKNKPKPRASISDRPKEIASPEQPVAVNFFQAGSATDDSCLSKCQGVSNANCSAGSLPPSLSAPMATLFQKVEGGQSTQIRQNELLKLFSQPSKDPCGRGDTTIGAKGVSNTGNKPCSLEATLPDLNLRIHIDLPKRLEASWQHRMNPMQLRFADPASAPLVQFLNLKNDSFHSLNAEFAGRVRLAESDGKRLVARTERGCIAVSFR